MSKSEGKKIGIRFTEDVVGEVSGYPPNLSSYSFGTPQNITRTYSSRYSSSYDPSNLFDGSTSSYWRTSSSMPQWVKIKFSTATWVNAFRWYTSSYRPNAFILEGSNDDETWTTLVEGNSENSTGWKEFYFEAGSYLYLRWTINSIYSSRLYIYEIEVATGFGNEGAFKVIGQEYKYVNGPLITKEYPVDKVEYHPTEAKSILLTMQQHEEFNNVIGDLTVEYDATAGSLLGIGGGVESFSVNFRPLNLVKTPSPNPEENITVSPSISLDFVPITYEGREASDSLSVAPAVFSVELIQTGVVNP